MVENVSKSGKESAEGRKEGGGGGSSARAPASPRRIALNTRSERSGGRLTAVAEACQMTAAAKWMQKGRGRSAGGPATRA